MCLAHMLKIGVKSTLMTNCDTDLGLLSYVTLCPETDIVPAMLWDHDVWRMTKTQAGIWVDIYSEDYNKPEHTFQITFSNSLNSIVLQAVGIIYQRKQSSQQLYQLDLQEGFFKLRQPTKRSLTHILQVPPSARYSGWQYSWGNGRWRGAPLS